MTTGEPRYDVVMARVHLTFLRHEKQGGDAAVLGRLDQDWVARHQPLVKETGQPCQECGEPWPCGHVAWLANASS